MYRPALCVLWCDAFVLKTFSLPLDRVASLVGICCCTGTGLWSWFVVLIRWTGSSGLTGRGLMLSLRGGTFGGVSSGSELMVGKT